MHISFLFLSFFNVFLFLGGGAFFFFFIREIKNILKSPEKVNRSKCFWKMFFWRNKCQLCFD